MNTNKRYWLVMFLFTVLVFNGCATTPSARLAKRQIRIGGADYIPLVSLCDSYKIKWKWDSFSQAITLTKNNKQIRFLIDSPVVLIDRASETIKPPARFHKGSLVVPLILKDRIIEHFIGAQSLYKQRKPSRYTIEKVVIDAGHGGRDPGAIGNSGLREKNVNLDIAKRLKELLQEEGIRVIMTRETDAFVPLDKRVSIANHSDADFFISIHSNANYSKKLKGFEVYYLSKQLNNIKRAQVAANTNSPRFNGMAMDSSSKDLKVILWDMVQTENQAESIRLAKDIYSVSSGELYTNRRTLKSGNYYVLKNTQMPALLIEVGYISNPYEEKKLSNSYYRENIAQVLAKAVLRK